MLEDDYNVWAEKWEQSLQQQFPQTSWRVARYAHMLQQGYVVDRDHGDLRPTGMLVEASNGQRSAVRFVVSPLPHHRAGKNPPSGLVTEIGEFLEKQLANYLAW